MSSDTLSPMPFTPDQLELIEATKEVVIETRSGDRTYRTIVWVVADQGDVYVRSVRADSGRWYQRVLEDPAVILDVAGARIPAVAVPANDPESVGRATEALRRKYRNSASLGSMIRPEVLGTTMRLEPA